MHWLCERVSIKWQQLNSAADAGDTQNRRKMRNGKFKCESCINNVLRINKISF